MGRGLYRHGLATGILLAWLGVSASGAPASESKAGTETFDFGPLASRMEDAHGTMRLRILGPLFEKAESPNQDTFVALRPLYAHTAQADGEAWISEYAWPVAAAKVGNNSFNLRVLTLLNTDFDHATPDSRYRLWVLPFWFQGQDKQGEDYWGLFPIYGSIHEFLTRDKLSFALWPLYSTSQVDEQRTTSVVWPFYSRTTGGGIYRHRLFPFYGISKQRDEIKRRFILWPLWTQAEYNFKRNGGSAWMLWPFYGQLTLRDQQVKWFLPPFFRMAQGGIHTRSHALWPILQTSTGETEKFYLWPIYGQKKTGHVTSRFFAWPLVWQRNLDRTGEKVNRSFAVPFWSSSTVWQKKASGEPEAEASSVYRKFWPLCSYRRELNVSRFRALALWPLKQSGPIERNWAPWWTLYQHQDVGGKTDTELLWGLYRRTVRPEVYTATSLFPLIDWRTDYTETGPRLSWNFLKGLVGAGYEADQRVLRILYFFHLGGKDSEE